MKTVMEIEDMIRAKADEDEAYRGRLLENPREAIKEASGLTVPEGFSINVHEESATEFHLVLPPAGSRLSDDELRGAAGGFAPTNDSY
ncbi:MAG: NHLP leader peptide family RiPP precursor [Gammaproteobacteria bacterium]|nr:NHLP leader peptide family RiPP precursor [Gammaproteobacteria bacterium]MXW46309.1 NHLP leader peptide family natural product precursor [Gammaproteobacteria bacterium]MYD01198.1 NHLP leader peptide family natural product precursor [Gammaproteobacteria bacterium]MYI25046.1 NHLP leader peptide family natural product precursor [Gammaproteobacteria bacterium]